MIKFLSILVLAMVAVISAGCAHVGVQGAYRTNHAAVNFGGSTGSTGSTGSNGAVQQVAHHSRVIVAVCDNGKSVGRLRSNNQEVCAYPGDRNVIFGSDLNGGTPGIRRAVCDNGKSVGRLRSNNQVVCAYRGDRNVIFGDAGNTQDSPNAQASLRHLQGCGNGQQIGYLRSSGQEICADRGDPRVVFASSQGGKEPWDPAVCHNGGRYMGGRNVCMD